MKDTSKSTMLIITTGFIAVHILFSQQWALTVALITGLTGVISPFLSRKIEWLWMLLAKVLQFIVPNILMTIIYFLLLFPLALLSRLFTKDTLMLSDKYSTYFVEVNKEDWKDNMKKPW